MLESDSCIYYKISDLLKPMNRFVRNATDEGLEEYHSFMHVRNNILYSIKDMGMQFQSNTIVHILRTLRISVSKALHVDKRRTSLYYCKNPADELALNVVENKAVVLSLFFFFLVVFP